MAFKGWERVRIRRDNGEVVEGVAPVIVSASRSTDIPAFYGDWLMDRLERGYVKWLNPFGGPPVYVSFERTRAIAFWTKNPAPFLTHLDRLDRLLPNYYFLFTLNDYDAEGYEPNVPGVSQRLETFKRLSQRLGAARVVWRFDPLLLSDTVSVQALLSRVKALAAQLAAFTHKLVVSFVDIERYAKVKRNCMAAKVSCREPDSREKADLAMALAEMGERFGLRVVTCAQEEDLRAWGIEHNRCIDDRLMQREFGHDRELMAFLGMEREAASGPLYDPRAVRRHPLKDKGQRKLCGCIVSKDIGQYNTCPHLCTYCYANSSRAAVERNCRSRPAGSAGESIV